MDWENKQKNDFVLASGLIGRDTVYRFTGSDITSHNSSLSYTSPYLNAIQQIISKQNSSLEKPKQFLK